MLCRVCADTVWFARLRPQAALPLDPLKIARLWEGETDAGQWDSVEGVGDFHNAAEEFVRFAERWIALVGSMNEDDLAGSFEYRHRSGIMRKQVVSEMLLHIFNHHTHHRGQISAGLAILARKVRAKSELPAGFKVPAIDLLYFVEEEKHKLAATGSD